MRSKAKPKVGPTPCKLRLQQAAARSGSGPHTPLLRPAPPASAPRSWTSPWRKFRRQRSWQRGSPAGRERQRAAGSESGVWAPAAAAGQRAAALHPAACCDSAQQHAACKQHWHRSQRSPTPAACPLRAWPSDLAMPMAIAVLPVPGCPASSTPRPAILPSLIICVITPAACRVRVRGSKWAPRVAPASALAAELRMLAGWPGLRLPAPSHCGCTTPPASGPREPKPRVRSTAGGGGGGAPCAPTSGPPGPATRPAPPGRHPGPARGCGSGRLCALCASGPSLRH